MGERVAIAEELGLETHVLTWRADYTVNLDWVLGHLASALNADQLIKQKELATLLQPLEDTERVESVTTTALVALRRI